MARKQDDQHRSTSTEEQKEGLSTGNSEVALEEILNSSSLQAGKALALQNQAGNRAILDTLDSQSQANDEESETQRGTTEKTDPQKTNATSLANRSVRGRMGGTIHEDTNWDSLFGGEDPPPATPRKNATLRSRLRSKRWFNAHEEPTASDTRPQTVNHAPERPKAPRTGLRKFYALDASLIDSERWISADKSPESLAQLSVNHPLMRVEKCAQFWKKNTSSPLSGALLQWLHADPEEAGHCGRISRSLGILALLQANESKHHGQEKTADASALALQEWTRDAVERMALSHAQVLSTPDLFAKLIPAFDPKASSSLPVQNSTACPLLLGALGHALPLPGLPPVLWPDLFPSKRSTDSDFEESDRLFAEIWGKTPQKIDSQQAIETVENLLFACARRRLWYVAMAFALSRTCGHRALSPLYGTLQFTDKLLRNLAIQISEIHVELQGGTPTKEHLSALRETVMTLREKLLDLDLRTQQSLVLACGSDPSQMNDHRGRQSEDGLAAAILDDSLETTPIPSDPIDSLCWNWLELERRSRAPLLSKTLKDHNNPWLEMRRRLNHRMRDESFDSESTFWANDAPAASFWEACIQEFHRLESSGR